MARLIVKNVGPIKDIDIELKKVNVFMGPQSCGKSTLAKIISFCSWLEKKKFMDADSDTLPDLNNRLKQYHKLTGAYFGNDSLIIYIGENISYFYNCTLKDCDKYDIGFVGIVQNKLDKIAFMNDSFFNPKVIYIPAERNFVSRVPNLGKYAEDRDNLQDFVTSWYDAKRHYTLDTPLDVLNLSVQFYATAQDANVIKLSEKQIVNLDTASSGIQSIVPLLTLFDWLSNGIYINAKPYSPIEEKELLKVVQNLRENSDNFVDRHIDDLSKRMMGILKGTIYSHTQFIIEEPEQNLYPETQCDLLYYMLSCLNHGKNHRAVITTHSPYILYALNNCLLANIVKDEIPEDEKAEYKYNQINIVPSDVAVWEIEDGRMKVYDENAVNWTIQDKDGLIRKNYFNNVMGGVMKDFQNLLMYKD